MLNKKSKLELGEKAEPGVPTSPKVGTGEVGTRLGEMAAQIGTREYAAKIAGVHVDTLYRWIGGDSKAAFLPIARLAQAAGKSLDWVATGQGEKSPPANTIREESGHYAGQVNTDTLTRALMLVELMGAGLPLEQKAKVVAAAYALLAKEGRVLDADAIRQVVESLVK